MYRIHQLNKISAKGTELLTDAYMAADHVEDAQGVMVRSAAMHDLALPEDLLAVARAGAGVNNIPLDKCAEQGIVVFNTPGANANSVMELALCGMLLACRDIVGGINWVQSIKGSSEISSLVEKDSRSLMNVPFVTGDEALDAAFVKAAEQAGLKNLKGHRSVGGMRASIYNAMPLEGVEKLVAFMEHFEKTL